MSEYKLKYSITEAEFMEAYEAHWKSNKQSTKSNLALGALGVLAGLALCLYVDLYGLILAVVGLVLACMPLIRRYTHIRAYRDSKKYQGEIEVTFADEQIEVRSNDGESRLKWSVYSKMLDTKNFLLLYLSPRLFSIVPKKAFAGPADEFIDFAKDKISQQSSAINSDRPLRGASS